MTVIVQNSKNRQNWTTKLEVKIKKSYRQRKEEIAIGKRHEASGVWAILYFFIGCGYMGDFFALVY